MSKISVHTENDIYQLREQFPILKEKVYGKPLVYLDNGATTQKPLSVIDAMQVYYNTYNSNVHRGVHFLSGKATDAFEAVRKKVQTLINAKYEHEIIYTSGTTGAINLVAYSFARHRLKEGDFILVSSLEHHSNIVPWQIVAEEKKAGIKVIPLDANGELDLSNIEELLQGVKLVAVNYVSNALGVINPIEEIITKAHSKDIPVLIDAAQAVHHHPIDVQAMDADFLAFSGHKMYGPTGIGVLYGKEKWLEEMPPFFGGGEMIKTVTFEKTIYNTLPFKFEAGTPAIAEVIGLGAAIDFMQSIGMEAIQQREQELMQYALSEISAIEDINIIGNPKRRSGVISFLLHGQHPYDVGELLDKQGVAVRTGHHCAEPLMNLLCIPGTVRASFAIYTTKDDIDQLVKAMKKVHEMLFG